MPWTNYHTHCELCDGEKLPLDYTQRAIELGMAGLGFSSHAPVPFDSDWNMKESDQPLYLRLVKEAQAEAYGRLPVFLGMEIDYIPGIVSPADDKWKLLGLDYTIGGVHYLLPDAEGRYRSIDHKPEYLAEDVEKLFGGGWRAMIELYFERVRQMITDAPPDIIAHLDLVKKFNHEHNFFDETASWYRDEIEATLDAVAASGKIMEVNTSRVAKDKHPEPYPGYWALERAFQKDISITLSADAHHPDMLTGGFDEVSDRLLQIGFEDLMTLSGGGACS